jgi:pimeloyl-ACP methyl ester carboxylesterase
LGSSILEGSLNQFVDSPCAKSLFNGLPGEWRDLWINTNAILQTARSGCLYDYLGLRWNGTDFYDHPHVQIRAKDWGGLSGVSTLVSGPNKMRLYPYFQNIINTLTAIGYTAGEDLRAAPYDWRKGYLPELYPKMRQLVEEMYQSAGNKSIWLVAHSMGGWQSSIMLSMQSKEWKQKHIAGFVSLGTPWYGASSSILAILSGLDINLRVGPVQIIDAERLHRILRSFGSTDHPKLIRIRLFELMLGDTPGLVWLLPRTVLSDSGFLIKADSEKMSMKHYFEALNRLGLKVHPRKQQIFTNRLT